jgi:hypothetical protein
VVVCFGCLLGDISITLSTRGRDGGVVIIICCGWKEDMYGEV